MKLIDVCRAVAEETETQDGLSAEHYYGSLIVERGRSSNGFGHNQAGWYYDGAKEPLRLSATM